VSLFGDVVFLWLHNIDMRLYAHDIAFFILPPTVSHSYFVSILLANQSTIINFSPTETKSLNDASAGTGTSTTDWVDLVIGEGGVIDWVVPGWRGEYKK
jgi:hypothetical protein